MPDIQPIHIGLLILIIFGAAAWYGFRKNADGDREAMQNERQADAGTCACSQCRPQ